MTDLGLLGAQRARAVVQDVAEDIHPVAAEAIDGDPCPRGVHADVAIGVDGEGGLEEHAGVGVGHATLRVLV
ncbi:hypothetical protein [Demequina litorisediminis]|uniref:Uncharacterized protein n=1 Tax=Demequina litorisediminis TaxID=1849022 RepID=A0ABQ6IK74_9MICO|nr:hypothetical protein [Demequina litorisediminis]GMA37113.1 hypothetical protein GCM10025876_33170 [Demequina litorisediminis]